MKKFLLLVLILLLITFSGCSHTSPDKSKYENRMSEIKGYLNEYFENKYNIKLEYPKDEFYNISETDILSNSTSVNISEFVYLDICVKVKYNFLNNDISRFSIELVNENCKIEDIYKTINVDEFCNIVNCISKRQLKKEEAEEFLKSNKKSIMNEDADNNGLISKRSNLDFIEDYVLTYDFYEEDNSENLCFYGNCK